MSLFCNWSLQLNITKINSVSLSDAIGFGILNSYYYVGDYSLNKIFILNESWSYISSKNFTRPTYLTTIGSSLYATGDNNIWKIDQNLNILIQYNAIGFSPGHRGIYYNSTNNFIM